MPDVVMPRLSDSMEEGTILRWLRASGDVVARGDELAEIETDKATMTYEADSAGVLELVAAEGETLPIGAVIARIGAADGDGGDGGAAPAAEAGAAAPAAGAAAAALAPDAAESPVAAAAALAPDAAASAVAALAPDAASAVAPGAPPAPPSDRVKASPVARRIAGELGVDIGDLRGTGPGGRIVKADVQAAAGNGSDRPKPGAAAAPRAGAPKTPAPASAAPAPAGPPAPAPGAPAGTPVEAPAPAAGDLAAAKGAAATVELSRLQQTVARRMAESRATVPDFTLTVQADMQAAAAFRSQLKDAVAEGQVAPSVNDLVVKACAVALREHPRANGAYKDGRFELYERVNVGVAVAGQDSLVVPTLFDADVKGLAAIAAESRALAARARDGTITPPELSGGTFTVSNLGMLGIQSFTAVISPPQAAILAVGAIEARPVVRDGEVVPGLEMAMTLSCDHRILYGADAAQFLARIRHLLEHPAALAL